MRMTHAARIGQAFAIVTVLSSAAIAIPGWSVGQALAGVPGSPLAIEPMTKIGAGEVGYFEDPYPVRLAPSRARQGISFSGTTRAVMRCDYPLSAGCFSWTPARIGASTLSAQIAAAGDQFTNFQNLNVFQADDGRWHAVLAIGVRKPGATSHWTVLVHAHPTETASPDRVPLAWTADTVLSGSFSIKVQGNYDGKYYEDEGQLYLLYVKNFVPPRKLRNGIVIQRMLSPRRPAPEGPVTLLTTGDRFGPLNSEWYDHTPAKLVEAPYISKIGGKYALIYSTGAYEFADYKVGVAWSDTLLPARNGRYRKVLQTDVAGVWGQAGRPEVHYLLQSQQPAWPNYTPGRVFGPGVASALQAPDGAWDLFFAGYDYADRPIAANPADAHHRRPYFVQLKAAVPAGKSVSAATDAELAGWLEPETR